MSSIFTRILSLAHLFYAYFTYGPNKSASAQYDNTRGAWLTQEGCTLTERKEGREARQSSGRTPASDETLKAVDPFYLVSMPGEVTYPTQEVNV